GARRAGDLAAGRNRPAGFAGSARRPGRRRGPAPCRTRRAPARGRAARRPPAARRAARPRRHGGRRAARNGAGDRGGRLAAAARRGGRARRRRAQRHHPARGGPAVNARECSVMILVFDIGNTETMFGLFEAGELLDHWRIASDPERTVDELGLLVRALIRESGLRLDLVRGAGIASVVPPLVPVFSEMCTPHLGATPIVLDASSPLPFRFDFDQPLTVGADRIVNTLAASRLYARDTIVVDLGTATTFD